MTIVDVQIQSLEQIKDQLRAILESVPHERPKRATLWITSQDRAKVIFDVANQCLLSLISYRQPRDFAELTWMALMGRDEIEKRLTFLARYGLVSYVVDPKRGLRPVVTGQARTLIQRITGTQGDDHAH